MCSNEQTEGRIRDYTRRSVLQSSCGSGNPIDDCWRCDPNWENSRQSLADFALGFGSKAIGGQGGQIYIVTDNSDYDTVNPAPGTLRYGVTQAEPLWIIFASDMNLTLKEELIMSSFKTIDGRGFDIHIAGGACLTLRVPESRHRSRSSHPRLHLYRTCDGSKQ
jgi:pectate lyase